jgi:hypothetical protein
MSGQPPGTAGLYLGPGGQPAWAAASAGQEPHRCLAAVGGHPDGNLVRGRRAGQVQAAPRAAAAFGDEHVRELVGLTGGDQATKTLPWETATRELEP